MATPAGGTYPVLWPRGPKAGSISPLAERPATLDGKKIAFLWDYLFRGDEIFPMLASELAVRYPGSSSWATRRSARRTGTRSTRSSRASREAPRNGGGRRHLRDGLLRLLHTRRAAVSAVAEKAGFPSSSLVCEGFVGQAGTTSVGLGLPNLPVAMVPGHVDMQTDNELRDNILGVTLDQVVTNLTEQPAAARSSVEPGPEEIVFEGTFEEVNRLFYENRWSDGLPFVPPTPEKIDAFLAFTELPPDHSLGEVPPDNRAATVRSVAANGVMAGCRPEYMPILVALAEAMADPAYGVEHSGNTPGSETLVTLNGPLIQELGFNYEQGALRDGFMANTTVGRFWRLYLRNVAGFLPHRTDKGTYGNTWRVVLAENEDVLERIGWEPLASDFGFRAGENAITISRYTGGDVVTSVYGQTAERMLPYLGDALVKQSGWQLVFTVGMAQGTYRPLLLLTPILAETIAKGAGHAAI